MAILGIRALTYGVEEYEKSVTFFADFGLSPRSGENGEAVFAAANGAEVRILPLGDVTLPSGSIEGAGVQEVTWGVDCQQALDQLKENLARDHDLEVLSSSSFRCVPFFGIPMTFSVWHPAHPAVAPDAVNAPGLVRRLNTHKKWRRRAYPKAINHVVFRTGQYVEATAFLRERLGFRLSDIQKGFGIYLRADGSNNHHNILFLNANAPLPGCDGRTKFDHANFGVEDIDELMVGVNNLSRRGWPASDIGLGRHRVDSGLFYYCPCPAGGDAEYGTDADYIDDTWVPRHFHVPLFGYAHWTHHIPHFLEKEPEWTFRYLSEQEVLAGGVAAEGEAAHV